VNHSAIRSKAIAGVLACLAWTSLPAAVTPAVDLSQNRVLLLYSYHPTFASSDAILQGVRSVFDKHDLALHIEYMDSKRAAGEYSQEHYRHVLSHKLSQRPPYDLALVSDDNALNFTLAHRAELFPATPIVFLAVNNVDKAIEMDRHASVTGVVEGLSYARTVELMRSLQRRLKRVVVVVDATPSGQADLAAMNRLAPMFPDIDFKPMSLGDLSWPELERRLAKLGPQTAVLRLTAFRDKHGMVLNKKEAVALMARSSAATACTYTAKTMWN
jgi:hypothetical protein